MFVVNLGGEGEVPGALNQQEHWAMKHGWFSSRDGEPLSKLVDEGYVFIICPNDAIALPDGCVDEVYTNGVPIDIRTPRGLGVQTSEIRRILKSGGNWYDNGSLQWTKP